MLKRATFQFLKSLNENNTKEWMNDHKADLKAATEDFIQFNDNLISEFNKFHPELRRSDIKGKDCVPKLNRDLRFTKDKSPYKPYFYAVIQEDGRRSGKAGYGFAINPGQCNIICGSFQPSPERLAELRKEIDYNFEEWKEIIETSKLKKAFPDGVVANEYLKTTPQGYESDNPALEYLKMKGFFFRKHYTDSELQKSGIVDDIVDRMSYCQDFLKFLNR